MLDRKKQSQKRSAVLATVMAVWVLKEMPLGFYCCVGAIVAFALILFFFGWMLQHC